MNNPIDISLLSSDEPLNFDLYFNMKHLKLLPYSFHHSRPNFTVHLLKTKHAWCLIQFLVYLASIGQIEVGPIVTVDPGGWSSHPYNSLMNELK